MNNRRDKQTGLRKSILSILLILMLAFSMCACGKKDSESEPVPEQSQTEQTQQTQKEEPSSDESSEASSEDAQDVTKEPAEPDDPNAAYQEFMANQRPVFSDNWDVYNTENYEETKCIYERNHAYTLVDLLTEFTAAISDEYETAEISEVTYSFIDCGSDGHDELVLQMQYSYYGIYNFHQFVIKLMDDNRLQIIYDSGYSDRSFSNISRAGYVSRGGSVSAMEHIAEYGYLNADGEYIFDYAVYSSYYDQRIDDAINKLREADPKFATSLGCENFYMEEFYFEEDPVRGYTSDSKDSFVVYESFDPDGVVQSEDSSSFDPLSEEYKIISATGLNVLSQEDAEAKIAEHRKSVGIPSNIDKEDIPEPVILPRTVWGDAVNRADTHTNDRLYGNGKYFLQYDDVIYFHAPRESGMNRTALFGEYLGTECGDTSLYSYDLLSGELKKICDDHAAGPLFVSGSYLTYVNYTDGEEDYYEPVIRMIDLYDLKSIRDSETGYTFVAADENGRYGLVCRYDKVFMDTYFSVVNNGFLQFKFNLPGYVTPVGIADQFFFYIAEGDQFSRSPYHLMQYNLETGRSSDLGGMPVFEIDEEVPGLVDQFLYQNGTIYFSYALYEGTGHMFTGAIYCSAPIDGTEVTTIETCGGDENTSESPAFAVKDGELKLVDGVPNTAGADYETGALSVYDDSGFAVKYAFGYGYESDEYGDHVVDSEIVEYIGDVIFVVRNDSTHVPSDDIGWRYAYKRNRTDIVIVDPKTREEYTLMTVK